MKDISVIDDEQATTAPEQSFDPEQSLPVTSGHSKFTLLKRLRGGTLFIVGYLLSPLCWWNDLIINLPIAYLFGYICNLFAPNTLLPGTIAGYWISNVVGILLMQFGVVDVFQGQASERNFKKELTSGVVTSTIYTLFILALVQLNILEDPISLIEEGLNTFSAFWLK